MSLPERIPSNEVLRGDFVRLVTAAKLSIDELDAKYLEPHISLVRGVPRTSDYDMDVAAYCVLAHGILEYLIEDTALASIIVVERDWQATRSLTRALLSAVMFFSKPSEPNPAEGEGIDLQFVNVVRDAIKSAKSEISSRVVWNNGISQTYVASLICHLGVNVRYQLLEIQASESLSALRGARAHGSPIYAPTSPQDARTMVRTMLGLFRRIAFDSATSTGRDAAGMPVI